MSGGALLRKLAEVISEGGTLKRKGCRRGTCGRAKTEYNKFMSRWMDEKLKNGDSKKTSNRKFKEGAEAWQKFKKRKHTVFSDSKKKRKLVRFDKRKKSKKSKK